MINELADKVIKQSNFIIDDCGKIKDARKDDINRKDLRNLLKEIRTSYYYMGEYIEEISAHVYDRSL